VRDEDPERQDKWTTWVEYLDYEYWWYDKDMRFVKRHQQRYDEAWKKFIDSKVLRPFKTGDFMCNNESASQRASEEERAEKAVTSAQSTVMLASKAITDLRKTRLSETQAQERWAAAQDELGAALTSLELTVRRENLIYEFHKMTGQLKLIESYITRKENAERRAKLLHWILQHMPLIELELKVAEKDSIRENIGEQRRPKRNRADDSDEERVSKRWRQDGEV